MSGCEEDGSVSFGPWRVLIEISGDMWIFRGEKDRAAPPSQARTLAATASSSGLGLFPDAGQDSSSTTGATFSRSDIEHRSVIAEHPAGPEPDCLSGCGDQLAKEARSARSWTYLSNVTVGGAASAPLVAIRDPQIN